MTETNNSKSDKEKLDEILSTIEEENYLLTKDYFELETELEKYFQICTSIVDKNLNLKNEAEYVAGLINELLGKTEDAINLFQSVVDDKNTSSYPYKNSLVRLFLQLTRSWEENFSIRVKEKKKEDKYLPLTKEELFLINQIKKLFLEIKNIFISQELDISISFSEILLRMSSVVAIEDLLDNKKVTNERKKYLEKILEINNDDDKYKTIARHHLAMNLTEDIIANNEYMDSNKLEERIRHIKENLKSISHDNIVLEKILDAIGISNKIFYFLLKAYFFVNKIKNNLKIPKPKNIMDYLIHETKVAHYTSPLIAYELIHQDCSRVRLNTINYVNDPTEGVVIRKYLGLNPSKDPSYNMGVFICCFTFNYDSLNQFRLYGKNNGIEASGVSIIFNNDFFNNSHYEDNSLIYSNDKENNNQKIRLYRCIYIEPNSNYFRLSRRDEITFYKQYRDELKQNEIDKLWIDYNDQINEIESDIKNHLYSINKCIENIKNIMDKEKYKSDIKDNIFNIINAIILPLQYLVKHAAFQEEQECRVIYLIDKTNDKIKKNIDKKLIYVEYVSDTKKYIDKIYFSPGAKDYKDFFVSKDFPESKLKDSLNPFRNK